MSKTYSIQYNVGKAKILITYYTGERLNKDGSLTADIMPCKTNKAANTFISDLEAKGYKKH